ncbi:exodeoxyribonuclease VII large subunit [Gemmobacter denitrificans]|uniref:Exodeoxyribonuclease 7 large subunit n=1 Tax=Gemmobacter denitrificans TaxID=3123040 RepID=A0ABU8BRD9_9RHOB
MMDLFEDPAPQPSNQPEYTVSELSGAVKRVIEGEFGLVRVRGEVGRVSRPASGHLYFDLKDDRSVIAAISWKGQVARMQVRPEEGMEVVATGRMTTFPGQSKYQLIVEDVAPAGAGALMAMLEKRRAALQAEGLFDPARKQPIPFLPGVIGVITSPSGAVIRDILHRLRDRFPRPVLIWPVAVQGQDCAAQVAAAIRGFNAIAPGGPIPRPDLLIVARGGGSLEDLWGFNEEIVVRAAADSRIPLISAVGHETDTTLIDFAADRRAPTPTAAAEMAVPVRLDLLAALDGLAARQSRALALGFDRRGQRLRDLARALPRPEALTGAAAQRLDAATGRLGGALGLAVAQKRGVFAAQAARVQPQALLALLGRARLGLNGQSGRLDTALARRQERAADRLAGLAARLDPALGRLLAGAARDIARQRDGLAGLAARLEAAGGRALATRAERLEALDRIRLTLGYTATLRRGYAVVRAGAGIVTTAAEAARAAALEIEFSDGRLAVQAGQATASATKPARPRKPGGGDPGPDEQGRLL